jgi:glycosyltransferase involved in cell wall biosynthesis
MKAVIVQAEMKQYRADFFRALHHRLAEDGIDLCVVYSSPNKREAEKRDSIELDGGIGVKVPAVWLLRSRLLYQHAWPELAGADLVIVEQASKHLLNYMLLATRSFSHTRLAFWGHGFNRQANGTWLGEFLKARIIRRPDWWFGYTSGTVDYLVAKGVSAAITTNVQNAIDTAQLAAAAASVTEEQVDALRWALGIAPSARVALFCGSLYSNKQIQFLIASSELIRSRLPDFHLVVIGDGPDRAIANAVAAQHSWVHYVGPKFGDDRAPYFRMSEVALNPGLVGLGILDAFAAGLPVFTTNIPVHSPEIEYLVENYNGVITAFNIASFADAVLGTLADSQLLAHLRMGASESARKYTLEPMVENFAKGVRTCLAQKEQ